MIRVFTIGFTGKSAEEFFTIIKNAGVKRVVDVRLYPSTQLSGFARKKDLAFFLKNLCGVGYQHNPELAPRIEILKGYKDNKISWAEYEAEYIKLLDKRGIAKTPSPLAFDAWGEGLEKLDGVCFLCAEPTAEKCHRRLLAEYLQDKLGSVEISHL